jgi:hypothetical protein
VQPHGVRPGVGAEERGRTAVGPQQAEQHTDGGGLTRAVRAEEAVDLTGLDREIETVEGTDRAEGLRQGAHVDDRGHGEVLSR